MKRLVLFTILITISSLVSSQEDYHSITGNVILERTNESLPFVNISLFDKQDELVDYFHTDIDGKFFIDSLKPALYSLKFTSVGFNETIVSKIDLRKNKQKSLDVKMISGIDDCSVMIRILDPPLIEFDNNTIEYRYKRNKYGPGFFY